MSKEQTLELVKNLKNNIIHVRKEIGGYSFVDYNHRMYTYKNESIYKLLMLLRSIKDEKELIEFCNIIDEKNWLSVIEYLNNKIKLQQAQKNTDVVMYPITMSLNITTKCNLRCSHCYEDTACNCADLSIEAAKEIAKQASGMGIYTLVLTGGEPTLNPNWLDISKIFYDYGFKIMLNTNGTTLTPEQIVSLKSYGIEHVHISLDGDEDTHDKIRGKGAFKRAMQSTLLLRDSGMDVEFLFTANKLNYKLVEYVLQLTESLGITMKVKRMIPTKFKEHNKLLLNKEETKQVIETVLKYKYDDVVALDSCIILKYGYARYNKCMFLSNQITTIDVNGDVFICPYLREPEFKIGNIFKENLKQIWDKYFQTMKFNFKQDELVGYCSKCKSFNDCSGGCRAWSYWEKGDFFYSDETCNLQEEI